jgi:3-hydroxybutyryl-CoA dehydrogenase
MSAERIAVVGAGLMGHGLAQVFAAAGHPVTITDARPEALANVRERIAANLTDLGGDADAAERVTPVLGLAAAVADADVVIEAILEDVAAKQALFGELERHCTPEAILATNTSVIPVTTIGSQMDRGERMLGTHWWNPPYLVPLVEVVPSPRTAPETVQRVLALLTAVGKSPVHVRRDIPGFIGNRLQHALWREAIAMVADGVCDAQTIDTVVTSSFGPRLAVMGPMENADLVGLDLTLAIHEQILPDLDRTPGPAPYLKELVTAGELGMKSGQGFQSWPAGAAQAARERLTRHLRA